MTARSLPPPGGTPAPVAAMLGDGTVLDLQALAREICRRYRAEFPDEEERYGEAGIAWCVHDNQHILSWAAGSLRGWTDLDAQLTWLARVLGSRGFPVARLARNLELAADVVAEELPEGGEELQAALRGGAELIGSAD